MSDRNQLRKSMRQKRRDLDINKQRQHAQSLARLITHQPLFLNAKRIACYLAEDGEIDPSFIIEKAWQLNKEVFLPVLSPTGKSLLFAPFKPSTKLTANRFNIDEPDVHPGQWLGARQLNLILLPLVAFDSKGNRLGMGGGYYDRSLAFTAHRKQRHSPYLTGLAHELQQVNTLPCESWDVPLNLIATEKNLYKPQCQ